MSPRTWLEEIHPRNLKYLSDRLQTLIRARLWLQILIGLVLGVFVGYLLGPSFGAVTPSKAEAITAWLALPGHLFLAMIQMIVVPLLFASIVRGIAASEDVEQLRQTGLRLVGYFLSTTAVAVGIGIMVGMVFKPGSYVSRAPARAKASDLDEDLAQSAALDVRTIPKAVVEMLPRNPLEDAVETNMLQIVLFSIVVGLALVTLRPRQAKPLLDLLGSLQSVCMTVVKWTMLIAPLAVFGLMVQVISQAGIDTLVGIGAYVVAVIVALAILFVFYLVLVLVFTGRSPWFFIGAVREVLLLAFSTDSSVAVMPLSVKTCEEKLGVRSSISQFVIPVGATVNMAGSAAFQGVATLFMAQVYGVELAPGMLAVLLITAIGASIGTPATPGVGVIVLSVVLKGVGVPIEGIALIIGVDRLLEMFRTSVNVTGDLVGAMIMERVLGKQRPSERGPSEAELEARRAASGEDVLVNSEDEAVEAS